MDDPLPQSPYKTLNVPKDATLATIRSAHRKLVLSCHPDKVQDESAKKQKAEQFHQVQQAYEILSDENRRQRYDEKVKLAELRAEMAEERGSFPSRASYEYTSPRNGSMPKFEMRGEPIYEFREPAGTRYDEPESYGYTEPRTSTARKSADDRYTTSTRKTSGSGRMQDDRKKSRAYEEDEEERRRKERRDREAERAAEAKLRDQGRRRREKERRTEAQSKSRGKFEPYVEDDVSDSELEDRYNSKSKRSPPPKKRSGDEGKKRSGDERKRSGEERRKDREEPRRSSKREEKYDELSWKESQAREHINKSRDAAEPAPRRSEGRNRAGSIQDSRIPPPPPHVEKRPSARRSESRAVSPIGRSGKDRRSPEIVESRRPSLPLHSTESSKSKRRFGLFESSRKEPQRSATYQPPPEFKQPSMRRAETMPVDRMRPSNPAVPLKSSNLKNMKAPSETSDSSSDSDSEMTEEPPQRPPPIQRKTTYGFSQEGAYVMEPEVYPARPKESHRASERPSMAPRGASTRSPPMPRAMSSAFPPDDRRPGLSRHESGRGTSLKNRDVGRNGELFGEYIPQSPTEDSFRRSPKTSGDDRPYNSKQHRWKPEEDYRDDYPFSHRPRMGRSESQTVRV